MVIMLGAQAGVGFHKRTTETEVEKSKRPKVFDASGCLALFGLSGLFGFSTFLVFWHCSNILGFSVFRLLGFAGAFRTFLVSRRFQLFLHFHDFACVLFCFSGSAVRFGFSCFWTFRLCSCLFNCKFDWALADSIVTRFLESVIVPSVVVVARSGLPALADGGFFCCPKPDAPLSKTAEPCP